MSAEIVTKPPLATVSSFACPKCAVSKSGKRSCCGQDGAWFKNCGDPGDSKFDHTWTEGIKACKPTRVTTTLAATTGGVSSMPVPCDQASDFEGSKAIDDSGNTCRDIAPLFIPSSVGECGDKLGESTKGEMIKHFYTQCCKPGSKPNGICGFKLTLPCDQASDFDGTKQLDDDSTTCYSATAYLPSSAEYCDEKIFGSSETMGDMVKHIHSACCKPGSKPNGICGYKLSTSTPCQSKSAGEFLPGNK